MQELSIEIQDDLYGFGIQEYSKTILFVYLLQHNKFEIIYLNTSLLPTVY